jgi:hypothetical protein
VDFRPRSWIVVASLSLLAAVPTVAFAAIVALLFHEEADAEHANAFGVVQLVVAGTGLVLAAVAVVESARDRGRPWRWLLAAAVAYVVWVGLLLSAIR